MRAFNGYPASISPNELTVTKVRLTLNAEETVDAVKIAFPGASLPIYIDAYGHLHIGDIYAARPNLQGGGSGTLGEALGAVARFYGDPILGDIIYFGAATEDGLEVQQIGARCKGAFPSATVIGAGEPGFDKDGTGSGYAVFYPDVDNEGTDNGARRGVVLICAHGSGEQGNEIWFGTRNAPDTFTVHWKLAGDGGIFAVGATGGSMGPGTINAKGYYVDGAAVVS